MYLAIAKEIKLPLSTTAKSLSHDFSRRSTEFNYDERAIRKGTLYIHQITRIMSVFCICIFSIFIIKWKTITVNNN